MNSKLDDRDEKLLKAIARAQAYWAPAIGSDLQEIDNPRRLAFTLILEEVLRGPMWLKPTVVNYNGYPHLRFAKKPVEGGDRRNFECAFRSQGDGQYDKGLTLDDRLAVYYDAHLQEVRLFRRLPNDSHGDTVLVAGNGDKMEKWSGWSNSLRALVKGNTQKGSLIMHTLLTQGLITEKAVAAQIRPEDGIPFSQLFDYPPDATANPREHFTLRMRPGAIGPQGEAIAQVGTKRKGAKTYALFAPITSLTMKELVENESIKNLHVLPVIYRWDKKWIQIKLMILETRQYLRMEDFEKGGRYTKGGPQGTMSDKVWQVRPATFEKFPAEWSIHLNDLEHAYHTPAHKKGNVVETS